MIPEKSERVRALEERLLAFMEEHIYPTAKARNWDHGACSP
jgi:hypothetical protein